jgi:glutamate formiminotransferase
MMPCSTTLIGCVPNFSEGRDPAVVEAIVRALLAGPDVYLLDQQMDADHNRSVITFVGTRQSVGEAALRGIGAAAELIDLNHHQGVHPRLGATDVVPFVPLAGVTMEDCVHIAEWVAEETWRRLKIPTYLYAAAARKPERVNLENIRRGQFEGVREEIGSNPARLPDFGEARLHPTAGATAVGARRFLIAYNINLRTSDVSLAKAIARKIRTSSGGFPGLKAMGVELKTRKLAQVSMNLTDFQTTSLATVFEAVTQEAAQFGVQVAGSEIVGLVPRQALDAAAGHFLRVENFRPELILENRLEQIMADRNSKLETRNSPAGVAEFRVSSFEFRNVSTPDISPLRAMVEEFVNAVAAPTPTPAGGSVAALAGALAAGLGEMVCGVSLKRQSLRAQHSALEATRQRLAMLRARLMAAVDRDAESYEAFMRAGKLPQSTEAERTARGHALEAAGKQATVLPVEIAELAATVAGELAGLAGITIAQAAPDLSVAMNLAATAQRGGIENARANLAGIRDESWRRDIEARMEKLGTRDMG